MTKRALLWLLALLLLTCPLLATAQEEESLLLNGGFELLESGGVYPVGWDRTAYRTQSGFTVFSVTDEKAHSGQYSAKINNVNKNDARFITTIEVAPETMYRISGYVLVESMDKLGNGANFGLEDIAGSSECLYDTNGEWQYLEWYGETGEDQTELTFGVRVGGFSSESKGCAYFDDMRVDKVDRLPDGVTASLWYSTKVSSAAAEDTQDETKTKSTALLIALAIAFLLLGAAFLMELRRPKQLEARQEKRIPLILGICLTLAFALRIVLAIYVKGYDVDINCFTLWSKRIAQVGMSGFYAEDYFCDYPPAYLYILYLNGLLMRILPQGASLLIIKLFPILCDMAISLLLYKEGEKTLGRFPALLIALLYAFNPASLVTGAAWGQVDAALTLLLLLTTLYAMRAKWLVAIPLFFVSALCKPQALLLAPVGGMWLIFSVYKLGRSNRKKALLEALYGFLIAAAVSVVIVLPFSIGHKNLNWLIDLYRKTLASYDYATVNTANLYYLLGGNWSPLTEAVSENAVPKQFDYLLPLLTGITMSFTGGAMLYAALHNMQSLRGADTRRKLLLSAATLLFGLIFIALTILLPAMTFLTYGTILFALAFVWALCFFLADAKPRDLPFALALTLIGLYVLTLKMHERYLYTGLALLLLGYIETKDRRLLHLLLGFSVTTFLNTGVVLDNSILFGSAYGHLRYDTEWLNLTLSCLNVGLLGYAVFIGYTGLRESKTFARALPANNGKDDGYRALIESPKDARLHLRGRDYLIMGVTVLLYGALCFSQLGSTKAPQSSWTASSSEEQIVFEVDTDEPYELLYYGGVSYNDFYVATSTDGANWSEDYPCQMNEGLCYCWLYAVETTGGGKTSYVTRDADGTHYFTGRYLRLSACFTGLRLYEIVARDASHNVLPISVVSQTGTADTYIAPQPAQNLIDEQDTLVGEPGWFTGTYFDEIYYVRTAVEHIEHESPYEYTHPPLGKLLITLGIKIFGLTPFGWRFMGALVGVAMLPAMYLLARQLTKRRDLSVFAMLVMALDLMHFAQTRIATIDSYPVLFIMLSYLCMFRFMQEDFFAAGRAFYKTWIPLGLSGLFIGLAIASKWIGVYAAAGLAVLFFSQVVRVLRASGVACYMDAGSARVLCARDQTLKRVLLTCLACVGFFLVVPFLIYFLSYIPHLSATGKVTVARMIEVQESMLKYHSKPGLGMDHPFQSPWYQWPLILKPLWFAKDYYEPAGYDATIMCMGNPFIFYTGAAAMLALLGYTVKKYLTYQGGVLRHRQGDGDLTAYQLTIGFLAQYLPWVLVPRSMYIYHYFASVPFIMLANMFWLGQVKGQKLAKWLMIGYIALSAAFFVVFYPYASGLLVKTEWLKAMRWFPGLYY